MAKLYTHGDRQKLKLRYRLFAEVLGDISRLSEYLINTELQRAFQNIIMNGVLHNPPETVIEISMEEMPDHQIKTEIKDNGRGMDKSVVKNLFTRYYHNSDKKDTNFSGGLGLNVAKTILEAHGGTIEVASVPSLGTLFTVVLFTNLSYCSQPMLIR